MLPVAGAVDIEAYGVHGDAVEDGNGERGVAEIAPPCAQLDVRAKRSGGVTVALVDEVEERVSGGGLVFALFDLAEPHVIDDKQIWGRPALEPDAIGGIGKAGVEVVEQVDTSRVANGELLLTCAQSERLQDVAFAGAAFAGDHQVFLSAHELHAAEFHDEGFVDARLKGPIEGFERFVLTQSADGDTSVDASLELECGLLAEDVLEELAGGGFLARGPGEILFDFVAGEL